MTKWKCIALALDLLIMSVQHCYRVIQIIHIIIQMKCSLNGSVFKLREKLIEYYLQNIKMCWKAKLVYNVFVQNSTLFYVNIFISLQSVIES